MKLVKSIATITSLALLANADKDKTKSATGKVDVTQTGAICDKDSACPKNQVCSKSKSCVCRRGYSGDRCQLPEPQVKCLPDRIEVRISKAWAKQKANVDSPSQIYLGSDAEDTSCQSAPHPEDPDTYLLRVDEAANCGTRISRNQTTSDYLYTNEVLSSSLQASSQDLDAIQDSINISRTMPTISLVNWQCVYKARYDVSYRERKNGKSVLAPIKVTDKITLPNSSEVKIRSFADDSYSDSQTSTLYDGEDLFLQLKSSTNLNFDINRCSLRRITSAQEKGDQDLAQIFSNKQCQNSDFLSSQYPSTRVLANTKRDLKLAYKINRSDFVNADSPSGDPQIFVRCEVTQDQIFSDECAKVDVDNNNTNVRTRRAAPAEATDPPAVFVVENGPFVIKPLPVNTTPGSEPRGQAAAQSGSDGSNSNSHASDTGDNGNDEEHALQPDTQALTELITMLARVKDSVLTSKADAVQLEAVLQHLQRATEDIKPLVELTSEYSLTEFDTPGPMYSQLGEEAAGDYIQVNQVNGDEIDHQRAARKVRAMIVLAVSIGVIFLCLIALPVLFVFYRNNVSSKMLDKNGQVIPGSGNGNGKPGSDGSGKETGDGSGAKVDGSKSPSKFDQHQIITIDTGLNVDHALHFVEYTDHIHDLVFEEQQDADQYPTNMWIKQISTDTQSIDISNQDPIKMTYTNSLYTKNAHHPSNTTGTGSSSKLNPTQSITHAISSKIHCDQDVRRTCSTSSNDSSRSSINSFSMASARPARAADLKELPVPSYVTMQSTAVGPGHIKRKKSFRLAGVKIPSEIINTIMPHQKTSKPYKTNNNNIVNEATFELPGAR